MQGMQHKYVIPQWPVPEQIKSVSTTRQPGCSTEPFNSFNLGTHVGDDPAVVEKNRAVLQSDCSLPAAPQWLNQVHGCVVHRVDHVTESVPVADAAWTNTPNCVLSIMTADCLPVLLASRSGDCVAALHGGWRGLAEGVVKATVDALPVHDPADLIAWLGPAIGPQHFEVGAEVRSAFVNKGKAFSRCFVKTAGVDKYLADIFEIGRLCLHGAGVLSVHGGGVCTFKEKNRFFSHRRDAGKTGRMASLIWINP
jgi:YfiH family protein